MRHRLWESLVCGLVLAGGSAYAQSLPAGVIARVNKQDISKAWLDAAVEDAQSRGLADSPRLRGALSDELVVRNVLAQRAHALKLDTRSDVQARVANAEQTILAAAVRDEFYQKHNINPDELRQEYDAQVALLKQAGPPKEFHLSHIVVKEQAQAAELIKELGAGASFEALAKANSMDPSRNNGGDLGWVLPQTIFPEIAAVIPNVAPGVVAAAPVHTRIGWHVIKVQDTRPYDIPSFDASQAQLKQAVLNKAWASYFKELLEKAKVQR